MTRNDIERLRDCPPYGVEPIVKALCAALLGPPLTRKQVGRLNAAAQTWSWCDPGIVALLSDELARAHAPAKMEPSQ